MQKEAAAEKEAAAPETFISLTNAIISSDGGSPLLSVNASDVPIPCPSKMSSLSKWQLSASSPGIESVSR